VRDQQPIQARSDEQRRHVGQEHRQLGEARPAVHGQAHQRRRFARSCFQVTRLALAARHPHLLEQRLGDGTAIAGTHALQDGAEMAALFGL
jgi:hypothetical protein